MSECFQIAAILYKVTIRSFREFFTRSFHTVIIARNWRGRRTGSIVIPLDYLVGHD